MPEASNASLAPTAGATATATTTIATSSSDASTTTTLEFESEDDKRWRRGKRKTHLVQELNGVRKASGRALLGKHVSSEGKRNRGGGGGAVRRFRPLFMPRFRRPEVVENPIDLFVASATPGSRKRSQSDSLLSGGSISNCSMTHIEPEFTQKELSEVMGRMKNVDA